MLYKLLTCTKDSDKTPTTLVCCLLLYKTITTLRNNTHVLEQASEKLQLSRKVPDLLSYLPAGVWETV